MTHQSNTCFELGARSRAVVPSPRRSPAALLVLLGFAVWALLGVVPSTASAAPEAHLLRIDPRTGGNGGSPVITTVVEVQQSKRISQATAECAVQKGTARLGCMAQALEAPLYTPFPFPEQNALFTVAVDGTDRVAKLLSVEDWGKSQRQPGVGTAWLILIDADARMGASFADARTLADKFVSTMGPNDIVNLMFFSDRQVFKDSGWMPVAKKAQAKSFISSVTGTVDSQGRNRPLLTIIKNAATDGFKALGNAGEKVEVPLHQAMVVLSTGFGGADPSTTGPAALQLSEYMTNGRFPEDNTALPKTPVPVISIYFPTKTFDEFANNSLEFMQNMANSQIGGFFNVVQAGEGEGRSAGIVAAVRKRFSKMFLVKWKVSCIAPSVTQSFQLVFKDTNPPIVGDASFKDVPIGIDPTTWPLDVNVQQTQADVKEGVYPGGTIKIYGDFCWGGEKGRAEIYFVPAGQALPTDLTNGTPEQAKQAQQQLISMGMRGEAVRAADTFAEFTLPDNDKLIHGSGDAAVARVLIYDNVARRMSGATAENIVTVKARNAPFPLVLILGGLFGAVVIALAAVVLMKGGNKNKRRPAAASPAPMGYGAPAQPGGYGAPAQGGYGGPAPAGYAPAPMAPTPLANVGPAPMQPSRAVMQGAAGVFTVVPGIEMRVGRDGATCAILLNEAQVSSFHATVKLEGGTLFVRDENSNNGTFIQGVRIGPSQWAPVAHGGNLRFGPVEFTARLE